eukprot:1287972-Amphidinium_carterae.1
MADQAEQTKCQATPQPLWRPNHTKQTSLLAAAGPSRTQIQSVPLEQSSSTVPPPSQYDDECVGLVLKALVRLGRFHQEE